MANNNNIDFAFLNDGTNLYWKKTDKGYLLMAKTIFKSGKSFTKALAFSKTKIDVSEDTSK